MKNLSACLLSFLLTVIVAHASPLKDTQNRLHDLEDLKWQHRLVLVEASQDQGSAHESKQLRTVFDNYHNEIADRHILWFILEDDQLHSNFHGVIDSGVSESLKEKYFRSQDRAVLIGKDGYVKSRETSLDIERFFALIDRMPMRLNEMRNQSEAYP